MTLDDLKSNIEKMKDALAELGFFYEDPMGQTYKETRTDLDASISGKLISLKKTL